MWQCSVWTAYGDLEAENYKQLNIYYEISRSALLGLWSFLLFKTILAICGLNKCVRRQYSRHCWAFVWHRAGVCCLTYDILIYTLFGSVLLYCDAELKGNSLSGQQLLESQEKFCSVDFVARRPSVSTQHLPRTAHLWETCNVRKRPADCSRHCHAGDVARRTASFMYHLTACVGLTVNWKSSGSDLIWHSSYIDWVPWGLCC